MAIQFLIGSALVLASVLVGAVGYWVLESLLARRAAWLHRAPHGPKLVLVLVASVLWTLGMMAAAIWIWALAFYALDIFVTLEASVYFALVAFTTLGFGDVLLPQDWRLLSGMAAANGLLNFGLLTAVLVEVLRNVRSGQGSLRTFAPGEDRPSQARRP